MKKKLSAWAMSVALLLNLTPLTALAQEVTDNTWDTPIIYEVDSEESIKEAAEAINSSELTYHEIHLTDDVYVGYPSITFTNNTTSIIGNDHTLIYGGRGTVALLSAGGDAVLHVGDPDDPDNTLLLDYQYDGVGSALYGSGGATIYMYDGVTIQNFFQHNGTPASGVYLDEATFLMEGGTITGTQLTGYNGWGGAVATNPVRGGTFVMNGGTIENSYMVTDTTIYGGAVALHGGGTMIMTGGTIANNEATYGAGIYAPAGATVTITGGTISGNTATSYGGGIYIGSTAQVTITDGVVLDNQASYGGGAMVYGLLEVTGGEICGNIANYGGGIYAYSSNYSTYLSDVTMTDNIAPLGGAVYINSRTQLILSGSPYIEDNYTTEDKEAKANVYTAGLDFTTDSIRIKVSEALEDGASVGIQNYTEDAPLPAVDGYDTYLATQEDNHKFTADVYPDNVVRYDAEGLDNSTIYLVIPVWYTLAYDGNGGDGEMPDPSTHEGGEVVTVLDNAYTYEGFIFVCWNTQSDGDGDTYLPSDTLTMPDENVTLYAQWEEAEVEAPDPDTDDEDEEEVPDPDTDDEDEEEVPDPDTDDEDEEEVPDPNTDDGDEDDTPTSGSTSSSGSSSGTSSSTTTTPTVEDDEDTSATLNREDHIAYMQGYPDGSFRPDGYITRAETTVMFARLITEVMDMTTSYDNSFSDVTEDLWYYNEIGFMEDFGIIYGYLDGTFQGDNPITRAEFAAIVSRFDDLTPSDENIFPDVADDHWAITYINSAVANGWIEGYSDGTFQPDEYITRAEAVTLVNRVLIRYADEDYIGEHLDNLVTYWDTPEDYWAYYQIMEASNTHEFERQEDSLSEIWTTNE